VEPLNPHLFFISYRLDSLLNRDEGNSQRLSSGVSTSFAWKTPSVPEGVFLFRFQIKDEIKAARIEATKAYGQYVEEPKTSQR
jgi:hypothetical protein